MLVKNFDLNAALLKAHLDRQNEIEALEQYIWNRERSDDYFYTNGGYKAAKGEMQSLRSELSDLEEML